MREFRLRRPQLHLSRRSYLAITIAGVLVPTLFLTILGFQLVRRLFDFQGVILSEYSRFSVEYAASELQRQVTDEEQEIAQQFQLVSFLDRFAPGDELRRLEDTNPLIADAYFMRPDGSLVLSSPARADSDAARQARSARIARQVLDAATRQHVEISGAIHFYAGSEPDGPYHMTAFPLTDKDNHPRGVGGFFLNVGFLRSRDLERVLDDTIHRAEGRFAPDFGDVLTLVVRDDRDRVVYTHNHDHTNPEPCRNQRFLAMAELHDVLPGWHVGLTYTNPGGFGWMRHVVTVQLALLLLAAALIVIATIFSMRFSLRQMELSRLKSHFVSNITHELKTPLAAIRLYTETLQQGRVHDRREADRFLGIIHKESIRLAKLIDNILDFARIEDGRRRYRFELAPVGAIVREVVETYAYQLHSKGFDLQLEIEEDLPPALVDRDALGQAVLNLLDNAMKYSRDDRHITVSVRRDAGGAAGRLRVAAGGGGGSPGASAGGETEDRSGDPTSGNGDSANGGEALVLMVRDRGIGIPPAEQAKIFEAFYRVEKGLLHDVKGSGLGLAVVKHIVEAHGGSIEVESHPESGSTFTIRLPYRQAREPLATEHSA